MKSYEQAVEQQWQIAQHRIAFAQAVKDRGKGENPDCNCEDCKEHFAAMKEGPKQ